MAVNLELLARLVERGERVVLVLPQGDPVVLLPVAEYDRLVPRSPAATQPKKNSNIKPTPKTSQPLEQVDPQQGSLSDDDQYYPEPL